MSYRRNGRLGDSLIPGFSVDPSTGAAVDSTGAAVDWNQIISQGLQVVGQAINGQQTPYYSPVYRAPTSSLSGNALPLLIIAGAAVYFLTKKRGR